MHKMTIKNSPIDGMVYFLKALSLAGKPGIRRFIIIPLLVNVLVFTFALWLGIHYFAAFMDDMLDFSGLWSWVQTLLSFIKPLLWLIFFAAYLMIVFYSFAIVANLIAAPFNSLLAEAVERYLDGNSFTEQTTVLQLLKDTLPLIWAEIRKLIYFIVRALPLLLLFVIPFTAPIAPLIWFVFSAWMMSLQYMDYPMGNHSLDFGRQKKIQQQNRMFSLGFGSTVLLATMIPLVNFMVMPLAVISATQIWVERYKNRISA